MNDRDRLEDKISHLCTLAKRYSRYDPKYVDLHRQIDETLDLWELEVAVGGDIEMPACE